MKPQPAQKSTRTLYVTKYATTRGILKVTAEQSDDSPYAYYPPGNGCRNQVKLGSNAFETLAEARTDAHKKFAAKRRSLNKALSELDARAHMVAFNEPEDRTADESEGGLTLEVE